MTRILKSLILLSALLFSSMTFARTVKESINKSQQRPRAKIFSYLRISDTDQPQALLVTKRPLLGLSGCKFHRKVFSSRRCFVLAKVSYSIPHFVVNENNEAIYDNGEMRVKCGSLKQGWFKRTIELNDKCKLVSENVNKDGKVNSETFLLITE